MCLYLQVPSPQLLDLQQQAFGLDESAMSGFDDTSSQLDTSYSDSFSLPIGFGGLELSESTPEPGTVKKRKGAVSAFNFLYSFLYI
jgi:hypothetical protein